MLDFWRWHHTQNAVQTIKAFSLEPLSPTSFEDARRVLPKYRFAESGSLECIALWPAPLPPAAKATDKDDTAPCSGLRPGVSTDEMAATMALLRKPREGGDYYTMNDSGDEDESEDESYGDDSYTPTPVANTTTTATIAITTTTSTTTTATTPGLVYISHHS